MTDSRNVVHSLERASQMHSDQTRKKIEQLKQYKRKSRIKYIRKKMLLLNQMVKMIC